VTDGGDVRAGRLRGRVLRHGPEVNAVPRLAEDRGQRVALPLQHLQHGGELGLIKEAGKCGLRIDWVESPIKHFRVADKREVPPQGMD
jgi:hypothetical protein